MSKLKQEPPQGVRSIEELFAIAYAMEEEAAARYSELAQRLRSDANPGLAEVFERLARDERGHLDSVVKWSEREKGHAPKAALIRWKIPETFDDEGVGMSDPRLVSTYRALAMAVRNEERAFAFWTYVVAHAGNPEIARAAEVLAHEELEHVATLRRERRRAYRVAPSPGAPATSATDSAELERILSRLLEKRALAVPGPEGARLQGFAAQASHHAEILTHTPLGGRASVRPQPPAALADPVALSEILVDLYLEAADTADGESAVRQAQTLAGHAINRLAWLRSDLPEIQVSGS